MHRDPGFENLAKGGVGFVQAYSRRFKDKYFRRDVNSKVETDLVVGCYEYAESVEPVKT